MTTRRAKTLKARWEAWFDEYDFFVVFALVVAGVAYRDALAVVVRDHWLPLSLGFVLVLVLAWRWLWVFLVTFIRKYGVSIVVAVAIAAVIRGFFLGVFKIPTGSMRETLLEGDRIIVNKLLYRFREPTVGDVIVFKYPEDPKRDFIKRLIGRPGDKVEIREGKVYVNGNALESPEIFRRNYYYNFGTYGAAGQDIEVPTDMYYVLGDNSMSSRDSRYWGFVPRRYVIGKAVLIFWPPYRCRAVR